jgi:hypothetical protein
MDRQAKEQYSASHTEDDRGLCILLKRIASKSPLTVKNVGL